MTLFPLPALTDNYIWLIINQEHGYFDCVDPGDASPVFHFAKNEQLTLRSILLTHHHWDHIGGVNQLLSHFTSCKLFGPEDNRISNPHAIMGKQSRLDLNPYHYHILSNPGHTSTHISYYEPTQGWLFCGDTLFSAGCGRVFDGTIEELHESLLLFKGLPAETKLCCAHEYTRQNLRFAATVEPDNPAIKAYAQTLDEQATRCTLPSTMGLEWEINPFLRTDKASVQAYALKHGALSTDSLEVFKILRAQKDGFR